jgi:OmpA family/PEGA domain
MLTNCWAIELNPTKHIHVPNGLCTQPLMAFLEKKREMCNERSTEMLRMSSLIRMFGIAILVLLMGAAAAVAQSNQDTGSVKIHVSPKQAYVFVDGNAIRDGNQTIVLSPGKHMIGVYNYGYTPKMQSVDVVAGQRTILHVALQQMGEKVKGPFGDIELKGHPRAAVLLNGTTPSYFVGHVDEFDNNWIWHQWLLVKPGDYQVTVTRKGKTIWSGSVNVKAGQRKVVYLNHNGKIKTKDFSRGLTLGPQPRFDAGVASAMVPIAPVTAQLAASPDQTSCGQSASLNWKTADAVNASITNIGNVPITGDRTVDPKQTTTYELVAKGPGGEVKQTATIDVNAQPTATLTVSQPELRYHKIGDKVVENGSAVLNWTSDGTKVTLQPLGSVAANGSQTVEPVPSQTSTGPVNQDVTYTLHVTDACGGTAVRTASLHIIGSIDPPPPVVLASLFYPTNYPERRHSRIGLVASQERALAKAATTFKNNEKYDAQNIKLMVVGHADVRGPASYNLMLSKRRATLVKAYLVSRGIAADQIEIRADGKRHELTETQVQELQSKDKQSPPKWMMNRKKATWLAYNRRVDIILEPAGQESAELYPNDAPAVRILWERPQPSLKAVELASRLPHGSEVAQVGNSGN